MALCFEWRRLSTAAGLLSGLAATFGPSCASADPAAFPQFDVDAACHVLANYAFAATLGQADNAKEFALCKDHEMSMRASALSAWSVSSARVRDECTGLAEGRYTALTRCLEFSAPRRR